LAGYPAIGEEKHSTPSGVLLSEVFKARIHIRILSFKLLAVSIKSGEGPPIIFIKIILAISFLVLTKDIFGVLSTQLASKSFLFPKGVMDGGRPLKFSYQILIPVEK